ncbi:MAG: MCP four helix bundle domain-containing protein [Rhizobacter sp.]|nr:MCP four helix bundle domain-containing protein [Bacteriovorax sp.]
MQLKKIFNSETEKTKTKLSFSFSGLRGRILIVVMIPLLFLILVAGIALFQTQKISDNMSKTLNETVPAVTTSKQLQQELNRLQSSFLLAIASKDNEDAMSDYLEKVDASMDRFITAADRYQTYPMSDKAEKLRKSLFKNWDNTKAQLSLATKTLNEKKIADGSALFKDQIKPELGSMIEIIQNIELNNADTIEASKIESLALVRSAKIYAIVGSICAFVISLAVSFIFATYISKTFANVGANLSANADRVAQTATQIATFSQQLSEAVTQQAASLVETSAATEITSSLVKRNSENAMQAASSSSESQDKAEKGKKVVEKMLHSMDEINISNDKIMGQINHSNSQFSEIVKVIEEIGTKTQIINEIVFQTKLLSFNASVEAARAGEHGRGFAVVAEEIGNLAAMSGNAAREITELLTGSIIKVESIVKDTKSNVETLIASGAEKVRNGTSVAHQCNETLIEILENVSKVSNMAGEISTASQEQADGVGEITKAINQLDQVTKQNATTSEESAAAAEKLSAEAESLKSVVELLVKTIQGTKAA